MGSYHLVDKNENVLRFLPIKLITYELMTLHIEDIVLQVSYQSLLLLL